jgi:glyoxylate reductase
VKTILVTRRLPPSWVVSLEDAGHMVIDGGAEGLGHRQLAALAPEVDAVVSVLTDQVDSDVLEAGAAGRLRVVANIAVGYDNIDIGAAQRLGITVCNTPGVLDGATADIAMFLILACCRLTGDAETALRRGQWHGWDITGFLGRDLEGTRLGLLGLGRIGRAVSRRAEVFGMRVFHHARRPTGTDGYVDSLDELLSVADVLSIHVPLSAQTRGMIAGGELHRMPRGGILVNTARGGIVDEDDLVDALEDGTLAAAGLDVFENEPRPNPRLLGSPHLVLLPHVGSATVETRRRMTELACRGTCEVLAGHRPFNAVV